MVASVVRSVDGDARSSRGRSVLPCSRRPELRINGQATGPQRVLHTEVPMMRGLLMKR